MGVGWWGRREECFNRRNSLDKGTKWESLANCEGGSGKVRLEQKVRARGGREAR